MYNKFTIKKVIDHI